MANELPATNWLGYSLDLLTLTPMDIKAVTESVKKGRRIIQYYPDEDTRPVRIGDEVYDVPRCIGVAQDVNNIQGNYVTYRSGSEATQSFQVDASLSVRYLAVSGSASASYATEKSFRQENQYAFYSFNANTYSASLRDYADLLNESALRRRIEELPKPFDGSKEDHVEQWREFFSSFGTHVIINCSYGARYQLNVWASNSESSVNNRFSTSVNASFNGIVAGGSFDASVKNEEQYKTFSEFMQRLVSIQGGDQKLAGSLGADPTQFDVYKQWAESTATYSNLGNMNVVELWSLMRDAISKELRDAADTVRDAFRFLTTHTEVHTTLVALSIESDWAEFGLLTPSAVVIPDPNNPLPQMTVLSQTRVTWGKERSHDFYRETVRFLVVNDGSPIDFYISHGSKAGPTGDGKATIVIGSSQYINDQITDNNWNTVWFYQKPVSPQRSRVRSIDNTQPHTWNEELDAYLNEIGYSTTLYTA